MSSPFDQLPHEIVIEIFSYLSVNDLALNVKRVCRYWEEAADDPCLWNKKIYRAHFTDTEDEIANLLRNLPSLKKFIYNGELNFVRALCEHNKILQKVHLRLVKLSTEDLELLLSTLPNIKDLCISVAEKGSQLIEIIAKFKNIDFLILKQCNSSDAERLCLTPLVEGCPRLEGLILEDVKCSDLELYSFIKSKKRQLMYFGSNRTMGTNVLQEILGCEKLIHLFIWGKQLEMPTNIEKCDGLRKLQMFSFGHGHLKLMPLFMKNSYNTLTDITIFDAEGVNKYLPSVLNNCQNLRILSLLELKGMHESSLFCLRSCVKLQKLRLISCRIVNAITIKGLMENCGHLETLNLRDIPIDSHMYRQLCQFSQLKTLTISGCIFCGSPRDKDEVEFDGHIMQMTSMRMYAINGLRKRLPCLQINTDNRCYFD